MQNQWAAPDNLSGMPELHSVAGNGNPTSLVPPWEDLFNPLPVDLEGMNSIWGGEGIWTMVTDDVDGQSGFEVPVQTENQLGT